MQSSNIRRNVGSSKGAQRLLSGNKQQPNAKPSINYGGIPKTNNNSNFRGGYQRKTEATGSAQLQIQPKSYNQFLGSGADNYKSKNAEVKSVFDIGVRDQSNGGNKYSYKDSNRDSIERQQNADVLVENEMLRAEVQKLKQHVKDLTKVITEKDKLVAKQRTDLTTLRKKNFEFRSKITEIEDKQKLDGERDRRDGSRNRPGRQNHHDPRSNEQNEMMAAMQIQRQEMREREKQMIMMTMMDSMLGASGVEAEEQRLLQQAIEASRAENADPNNPDTDNMTYEQLLELEQNNGKVSKGLSKAQIKAIKEKTWYKRSDTVEESCSICFENFERHQKFKKLPKCPHEYHSECIDKWLEGEKRCPICNEGVI